MSGLAAGAQASGRVLVVDDGEMNRQLMRDVLEKRGHAVTLAECGSEELLRAVVADPPDAVVLDVMMPGIDGLRFCRMLKNVDAIAHVPILLLTSLNDRAVRLRGIESGANDFLLKPVDTQDIVLRVDNAIRGKRLVDELRRSYERLRKLEKLRDNLTQMVIHDLRSPLFAMRLRLESFLRDADPSLDPELRDDVQSSLSLSGTLTEMIGSILDISRLEAGEMPIARTTTPATVIIAEAVRLVGGPAGERQIVVTKAAEVEVCCDRALITRAVANLLGNSLKFSPPRTRVVVAASACAGGAEISVRDDGPGIPGHLHQRIFEKYGSFADGDELRKHSTGLGLPFCKLAVEAHGGAIGLESAPGAGSRFWMRLPASPMPRENAPRSG
jgi:two-component system, sensor histidine kinase and response regulator